MRKHPLGLGQRGGSLLSFFFSFSEETGEELGESGGRGMGDGDQQAEG